MKTKGKLLLLLLAMSLLLPLTAQAVIVDDGTECPQAPEGSLYHNWQYAGGQEANCQHGIVEIYRCSYCGRTYTAEYGGLGDHAFGDYTAVPPTCTQEGGTVRTCAVCGYQEAMLEIQPLGHDYVLDQKDATCTEDGYSRMVCSRCGDTIGESVLSAYGHDPVRKEGYPATCTESGMTDGSVCGVCGAVLEAQTAIPALGHDYRDDWIDLTAPACTAPGSQIRYCHRCQQDETRPVAALDHDWSDWTTQGGATCLEPGVRSRVCARCRQQETQEIPARNHDWGAWEEEFPGTCLRQGMKVRVCKRCGTDDYAYTGYGAHNWGEWQTVKEPTATEPGLEQRVCKNSAAHVEEQEIPPTGGAAPAKPADESAVPEGRAELTVTILTMDGNPPYGEKTEFKSGEEYWFKGSVANTGDVDVELWDCNIALSSGFAENGYTIGSRFLLHPGETAADWDGVWFAGATGVIDESSVTSGTETETLAGTLTFTVQVPGYRPGTDEVICTGEGSAVIGLLRDAGPRPALRQDIYWADDAGEGKRYEGAQVLKTVKATNTGSCTLYMAFGNVQDLNAPHPQEERGYPLENGESITWAAAGTVSAKEAEEGYYTFSGSCSACYEQDGEWKWVNSNESEARIPLTYRDGLEPEPARPELTLTVTQNEPEKEAYANTDGHIEENRLTSSVTVINTGSVPLNFQLLFCRDDTGDVRYTGYETGRTLAPGESWNKPAYWYYVMSKYMTPDPEDSPYAGAETVRFEAEGYDPETGETVCVSNAVSFTHRIAKPGPSPWEIPSLSAMTAGIKVSAGYESSDPAGYRLGEKYGVDLTTSNTGETAIPAGTIHVYDPFDGWTGTWYGHDFQPGETIRGIPAGWNWGTVTAEDAARGYICFPPVEFTWEDPDSGETRTAASNALTLPVTGRTGLLVEKRAANKPANGAYFTAGETIQWKVTVTNTSEEPIQNAAVTDQGETIGEFAEIAPGETKECAAPGHKVTEYDEAVGYVSNQAAANGTGLDGAEHTWFSSIAYAPTSAKGAEEHPLPPTGEPEKGKTGDPELSKPGGASETPEHPGTSGGGEDPCGPVYGVKLSTSIYKTTSQGPANGEYYELGETVSYVINIVNTGDTPLNSVTVTDSLHGISPIAAVPSIAPGASAAVSFFYTVTQADIERGCIVNQANIRYTFLSGIPGTPQKSNKVYVYAGSKFPYPAEDADKSEGKPAIPGGGAGDFCSLTLDALGGAELHYTLHACAAHAEAAKNAEEAGPAGAVEIWRAEIDRLYQDLYDAAQAEARALVMNDRAMFWAYADACAAMNPGNDRAVADMLRLRCAELCCMKDTAPQALAGSLLGGYTSLMNGSAHDSCERTFSALNGSDCEVTVKLNKDLARTLEQSIADVRGIKRYAVDQAFVQAQAQWQIALDSAVNAAYKAADQDARKTIAAWRKLLDQAVACRGALLEVLYPNNPETVQEVLANMYRDAAIDANVLM